LQGGFQTNTAYVETRPNACRISHTVEVVGALPNWEKEIWIGGAAYGPLDSPFLVAPGDTVTIVDHVSVASAPVISYTLGEAWTGSLTLVDYEAGTSTVTTDTNALDWQVSSGLAGTWYAITKTFTLSGDAGWTEYVTETLDDRIIARVNLV
jgi:hypothetical protein